ncbi:MAG: DUF5666 domain-containing protein [Firmicutes bacterium]|nr:hypothetical protein [Alicyclobacillaceae bacterium]MCL6497240.1 DUF5666 domain-containing protein [Bacillota bacterium]
MPSRWKVSRRTAIGLMAMLAAMVIYRWAFAPNHVLAPTAAPLPTTVTGEILAIDPPELSLQLAGPSGQLTEVTRQVALSRTTQYHYPGQPVAVGDAGLGRLHPGLRVTVTGSTQGTQLEATQVRVTFPPVTGVVQAVGPGRLTLSLAGAPQPMEVALTPSTAYYFPAGSRHPLHAGVRVQVSVVPTPSGGLEALRVEVKPPSAPVPSS